MMMVCRRSPSRRHPRVSRVRIFGGVNTRKADEPDTYVSVNEACRRFGIARRTFYRMLAEHPSLAEIALRIPPRTGRIRLPVKRFEAWLQAQQDPHPRGISDRPLGESLTPP